MADKEVVIKIPEELLNKIDDKNYQNVILWYATTLYCAIKSGIQLPKRHGRLIDADAFIKTLEDASKRQKYKKLLIDNCLTVDDVFKAVIESLRNEGLAKGDTPTIIEADKGRKDKTKEQA